MFIGRPILVWLIFAYSIYVAAVAGWAAIRIGSLGDVPGYETTGRLLVSLIPAAVLLIAGTSLFLLKRWSVWFIGATVLILISSIAFGPADTTSWIFLAAAMLTLIYSIWLLRQRVLV